MLWELVNMSDQYTFRAPSIEIAAAAVLMISKDFGAVSLDHPTEHTPVHFGWEQWLLDHGIDAQWMVRHQLQIADALDSLLIGSPCGRQDVEMVLSLLPPEKRAAYRDDRQHRLRSSHNKIGEHAYAVAKQIRERVAAKAAIRATEA